MSVQGKLTVNGQMSLIDPQPRTMDVYYSMPDESNTETGLLILVPGFGGNVNSNVYKKMRSLFADKYNLYVIQCDYFGSEFMQNPSGSINLMDYVDSIPESIRMKVINDFENNKHLLDGTTVSGIVNLHETESDYAEMGLAQSTDILIAVFSFSTFLKSLEMPLNHRRVIGYGHSHGAYLLYLCNGLMSDFFTDIIDVSAWLFPIYIDMSRGTCFKTGGFPNIEVKSEYKYLVSELDIDRETYDLTEYYQNTKNNARIYSFHGDEDNMIPLEKKISFLSGLSNSSVEVIGKNRVDNDIFSNNGHGLGVDFLKLFDYVIERYGILKARGDIEALKIEDMSFTTSKHTYWLGYDERIDSLQMYVIDETLNSE